MFYFMLYFLFFISLFSHLYSNFDISWLQASFVSGRVEYRRDVGDFKKIIPGNIIRQGASIQTYSDGYLALLVLQHRVVQILPNTLIKITKLDNFELSIFLEFGSIRVINNNFYNKVNKFTVNVRTNHFLSSSYSRFDEFYVTHKGPLNNSIIINFKSPIKVISLVNEANFFLSDFSMVSVFDDNFFRKPQFKSLDEKIYKNKLKDFKLFEFQYIQQYSPYDQSKFYLEPFFYFKKDFNTKILEFSSFRKSSIFQFSLGFALFNFNYGFLISFYPQITFDNLDFKMRFEYYVFNSDTDFIYSNNEWSFDLGDDFFYDFFSKISYLSIGRFNDSYFFSLERLDDISLAYGLNVSRYNSHRFYDGHVLGFYSQFDIDPLVIKAFLFDIINPKVFSVRISGGVLNQEFTFSKKDFPSFAISFTSQVDNEYGAFDSRVLVLGIDSLIPLYLADDFDLYSFFEISFQGIDVFDLFEAKLFDLSLGVNFIVDEPAFLFGFRFDLWEFITIDCSFRYLFGRYVNEYFDFFSAFDFDKLTQFEHVNVDSAYGFLFSLKLRKKKLGYLFFEFYSQYDRKAIFGLLDKRFHFEVVSDEYLIPIFLLSFYFDYFSLFDSVYELGSNISFGFNMRYSFFTWLSVNLKYNNVIFESFDYRHDFKYLFSFNVELFLF